MKTLWVLGGLAVLGFTLCAPHSTARPDFGGPPEVHAVREIGFPGRSTRGSFKSGFLGETIQTEALFASRLAPDQSVLTLAGDIRADWPLTRVRNWWTSRPIVEVLHVPGWSTADAKSLQQINLDVQISPNGRYAVAFVNARWSGKAAREPDTIITVVDLDQWQVLETIHTAGPSRVDFRGAWVANDSWIVLQGLESNSARRNQLFSIPGLASGPACTSTLRQLPAPLGENSDCTPVFDAVGLHSLADLEARIYTGHALPPWTDVRNLDTTMYRFNAHYDEWSRFENDLSWDAPSVESSSHRWYDFPNSGQTLRRTGADGAPEVSRFSRLLTCGNPALADPKAACGCRVKDVREAQNALLAYCQTGFGDYQWLAVFRSDDLDDVGVIPLASKKHVHELLASADGRAYVLTIVSGNVLRVLAVPQ